MSSAGITRRSAKKRVRDDGRDDNKAVVVNLDAGPPVNPNGTSREYSSDLPMNATESNRVTIDVDALDDEVQAVSPSRVPPRVRGRSRSSRAPPVVVIVEDLETDAGQQATSPLSTGNKRRRVPPIKPLAHRISSERQEGSSAQVKTKEPVKEVPKEPTFTCPVCLNKLVDPAATICGHIFCEKCIKTSIQSQKKCPTCRRSLRINNFHRVYLPNTE